MRKRTISLKSIILALAALIFVCAGLFAALFLYSFFSTSVYSIDHFTVTQEKTCLHMRWQEEKRPAGYVVILFQEGDLRPKLRKVPASHGSGEIELKELGKRYRIFLAAQSPSGGLSAAVTRDVPTRKLKQTISTSEKSYTGIQEKKKDLQASAHGKIRYESQDPGVVHVDRNGQMYFMHEGTAKVRMNVREGPQYLAASKTVTVKVYPKELDTPKLSVKELSSQESRLSWKRVKYASKYILYKRDPVTGDYVKIDSFKEKKSVTFRRDQAKYRLRAQTKVEGEILRSKLSEEADIKSPAADAKTYTSSHNLKTLDHSTLDIITEVSGRSGVSVPQSMSKVDDTCVITFVDMAGKKGLLVGYSMNGSRLWEKSISGMGHANGSTFDPNTGKIYTVKTHKLIQSASCSTYDLANGCRKEDFTLPRNTSGIAYDATNNKYYLSKGNELYVTDTSFDIQKSLRKTIRYDHAQDIGAYNGVVLVCTWVAGNESYIDLYRISDGGYVGSYYLPIGEIESCFVDDDRHLVILMNNEKHNGDCLLRSKAPIELP